MHRNEDGSRLEGKYDMRGLIYQRSERSLLEPGGFLILCPKDVHMSGVCEETPEKVIAKVSESSACTVDG